MFAIIAGSCSLPDVVKPGCPPECRPGSRYGGTSTQEVKRYLRSGCRGPNPQHERPRERLLHAGPKALADREFALLLRTGPHDRSALALAHSHPSGDASPSREDITTTIRIRSAAPLVGVELVDHLIVGDGSWLSLRESGLLDEPADDVDTRQDA